MSCSLEPACIVDIDGTLVDTNYHHAIAWYRAFRQNDVTVPAWRIHRHVGMGGDNFIPAVAGDEVESEKGEAIRDAHDVLYQDVIDQVVPLRGARRFLEWLKENGHTTVLASSAKDHELDHYLGLLDARDLLTGWTSSGDVERTKPAPDLIEVALEKAGEGSAVLIGDSVYDCESAKRAGIPVVGLLTGGFSEGELRDAGARDVFESLDALMTRAEAHPRGRREDA